MSQPAAAQYQFPTEPLADVLKYFNEDPQMDIHITENDVAHPTKERWMTIYVHLLARMTNNSVDELFARLTQIPEMDFPEVYRDGIVLVNLTRCMQRVMIACTINNFSTRDIIEPSKKRLYNILNAILNFIRFNDDHILDVDKINGENQEKVERRSRLIQENDEVCKKISAIKSKRADEAELIKKVREDIAEKTVFNEQIQRQNQSVQQQILDVKSRCADRRANLAKRAEQIVENKEELARLDSLIVQSPERAQVEIDMMTKKLSHLKNAKSEKGTKLASLRTSRTLQRADEADHAVKQITQIVEADTREKRIMTLLKKAEDDIVQKRHQMEELQMRVEALKRNYNTKIEKLNKIEMQHRMKEDALKSEAEQLAKSSAVVAAEEEKVCKLVEERRAECEKIQLEITESNDHIAVMKDQYAQLLRAVDEYNKRLGVAFSNSFPPS